MILTKLKKENRVLIISINLSVIVLSAKDSLDGKIDLLNSGAQDYITKPFDIGELIARVGVQLRIKNKSSNNKILKHKDLVLDLNQMTAQVCEELIAFTK